MSEPVELDDDDFAPPPPRGRWPKATVGLAVLAVAACGFLGGVLTQKHEGGTSSSSTLAAFANRARNRTAGEGFGAGGFGAPGGAGAPGGTGTAGAPLPDSAASTGTSAAAAPGPIAIGTVVSFDGKVLVVKDLGGKTHTIAIGDGVALTTSTPLTPAALKAGDAVTVTGTTAADGSATATSVTHRKPS